MKNAFLFIHQSPEKTGRTAYYYRNPWAKPHEVQTYTTYVKPVEYKGCQIFHVLGQQWDVVKAGVCIGQCASVIGAMSCAEVVEDMAAPTYKDATARMLERYGHL